MDRNYRNEVGVLQLRNNPGVRTASFDGGECSDKRLSFFDGGVLFVSVTQLDVGSGDEVYTVTLQGRSTSSGSWTTLATQVVTAVGLYAVNVSRTKPRMRLSVTLAGTTPSIHIPSATLVCVHKMSSPDDGTVIAALDGSSAALTGTGGTTNTETQIVTGGRTIIITLTDEQWVSAGAPFDAQRQAIINGLVSAQSEAAGWNVQVKPNLAVSTVVRTSSTVVTITLSAQAAYAITADETITVTVPAAATASATQAIVAGTTVAVTNV